MAGEGAVPCQLVSPTRGGDSHGPADSLGGYVVSTGDATGILTGGRVLAAAGEGHVRYGALRAAYTAVQEGAFGGAENVELMCVRSAGEARWVLSRDDGLYWIEGTPFGQWQRGAEVSSLAGVKFLPPCTPSKIIAVGVNYHDHADEMGSPLPEEPLFFLKPPSSILGHRESIIYPRQLTQRVEYEGELALVIGKRGKRIPVEEALDYVLGYTCANDVTARDLQRRDGQWTRAKGFDTFCPLGPVVRTDVDPRELTISTRLNGELRQHAPTRGMTFPTEVLVSLISQVMTLEPGDVMLTGTPSGVGQLSPGDVVEVEIEGIGTLANAVELA